MDLKLLELQKKLRKYRRIKVTAICCTTASIACFIGSVVFGIYAYRDFTNLPLSMPVAERKESYQRAIEFAPQRLNAYLLLLDAYNESGTMTTRESEEFLGLYNRFFDKINDGDSRYGELHYKAATLLMNSDGDYIDRLHLAYPFYDIAYQTLSQDSEDFPVVECAAKIGKFYTNYIWNTSGRNKEIPKTEIEGLLSEIESTLDKLNTIEDSDTISTITTFSEASINLIYSQRKVIATTIPQENVNQLIDKIYGILPDSNSVQSSQTAEIIEKLNLNKKTYLEAVDREYEKGDFSNE